MAGQPGDGRPEPGDRPEAPRGLAQAPAGRPGTRLALPLRRRPRRVPGRGAPTRRDHHGRPVARRRGPERVARCPRSRPRRSLDVRPTLLPGEGGRGVGAGPEPRSARAAYPWVRGGGSSAATGTPIAGRARRLQGLSRARAVREPPLRPRWSGLRALEAEDALLNGDGHGGGTVGDAELLEDVDEVGLDRRLAQVELAGQ